MMNIHSRGGSAQSNQEEERINFYGTDLSLLSDGRPSDVNPMLIDSELPDHSMLRYGG